MPVKVTHSNEWYLRDLAVWYGKQFLRVPYEYGDEDHTGMDCSGFVSEVLAAVGIKPHGYRSTSALMAADADFELVWEPAMDIPLKAEKGCLVFYGKARVSHVMLAISPTHVIGSTGGISSTVGPEEADERAAFVKVRSIDYRKDILRVRDPFSVGG